MLRKNAKRGLKTTERLKTLHAITEQAGMGTEGHLKIANEALEAGATVIQLRDKKIPDLEMEKLGRKILKMTKKQRALLIVNDRPNVAKRIGADGVHIGRLDATIKSARRIIGKKIIGASASSIKEALQAVKEGADYIGFGPIFKTESKPDASKPCGIRGLKKAKEEFRRQTIGIPLIAIGGISERNAKQVMKYANGIAVIGTISKSRNRIRTVRRLLEMVKGKEARRNTRSG